MSLATCQDCALHANGIAVPGRGPAKAKYMIIGEAPGREEAGRGICFIGQAGKVLMGLLKLAGIDEKDVYFTNSAKHWPGPGNPAPSISIMRSCRKFLTAEIQSVDPDTIILLGNAALKNFYDPEKPPSLKLEHGVPRQRMVWGRNRTIIPMYHPAAGLHQPLLKPTIAADFGKLKAPKNSNVVIKVDAKLTLQEKSTHLAIDLETTSLDVHSAGVTVLAVGRRVSEDKEEYSCGGYYANDSISDKNLQGCMEHMGFRRNTILIAHNGFRFDFPILQRFGVEINLQNCFDTLISAGVLGREELGLKSRALKELGIQQPKYRQVNSKNLRELADYACKDAGLACAFYYRDVEEAVRIGCMELLETEFQLAPILSAMTERGIMVSMDKLDALDKELSTHLSYHEQAAHNLAGHPFNLDSNPQKQKVLYEELGLQPLKRTKSKSGWSVDKESIKSLPHPIATHLISYSEYAKLKSTYVDGLKKSADEFGRVHTEFKQFGARSGRLSSAQPNLQNIPVRTALGKQVREAFIAKPGHVLLSADYSQIELRVAAALSQDPTMIQVFESGGDIHAETLKNVLHSSDPNQRRLAKNVNFGLVYGIEAHGLQTYLANSDPPTYVSLSDAEIIRSNFFQNYPYLMTWIEEAQERALKNGFTETLMHRRRYFPELQFATGYAKADILKSAVNHEDQGTAADIMKCAMVRLGHLPMLLQIHDELLLEVPKSDIMSVAKEVSSVMKEEGESLLGLPVEIEVKIGDSWGTMHAIQVR